MRSWFWLFFHEFFVREAIFTLIYFEVVVTMWFSPWPHTRPCDGSIFVSYEYCGVYCMAVDAAVARKRSPACPPAARLWRRIRGPAFSHCGRQPGHITWHGLLLSGYLAHLPIVYLVHIFRWRCWFLGEATFHDLVLTIPLNSVWQHPLGVDVPHDETLRVGVGRAVETSRSKTKYEVQNCHSSSGTCSMLSFQTYTWSKSYYLQRNVCRRL